MNPPITASRIVGTGSYLPPDEVDNQKLCKFYPGKGPQWIADKLGVQKRRFGFDLDSGRMREGLFDNDLAEKAAQSALEMAGIDASELDLIIRVTCTPEYLFFPDAACVLHNRLKANRDCAAFTIPAGCGGLIYAVKLADGQIKGGSTHKALIVASNTPSSYINTKDAELVRRNWFNAAIFGDGAGALVLQKDDGSESGILATYTGAWHKDDPLEYAAGGSRNPTTASNIHDHYFLMDSRAVDKFAHEHLRYALERLKSKYSFSLKDVNWFLLHQPNLRILERFGKVLDIPMDRILVNVDVYGNTSAASIGILLDEAVRAQKIKTGDLLVLVGVGAGWQYGAVLVRW